MLAPKIDLKKPYVLISTFLGVGFMRPASGTWASLVAIPFAALFFKLGGAALLLLAIIILTYIGIRTADMFERETSLKDSSMIVIDEVAGQWIALLPVLMIAGIEPLPIALAFLIFRILDVFKPWPICWIDHNISGGLGVMLDDIVAGILSAAVLTGILYAGFG